ncbi:MAG: hypothetical protein PHQ42_02825 [Patescibacteria group bacterium]|nr:hypothetical protein [Patescibacteria group bacterium]
MDIVIDFSSIFDFLNTRPDILMWRTFLLFGWIPIALAFLWGAKEVWLFYIKTKWDRTIKHVLLAIDIPRGNEQTIKAVENLFTYFGGAHKKANLIEKYWVGEFQLSFSFEIISIDGYTQFLIRTPVKFRDMVEAAVYSQYPDAEITEVNDYTEGMPDKFPDEVYDIWGCEFIQAKKWVYPIKTYKEFEQQLGPPEAQFKDPMATLMDLCSSLKKGEQLWFQILIKPMGFDWPEEGEKEVKKILKEKVPGTFANEIIDKILGWIEIFSEAVYKLWGDIQEKDEKDDSLKMMQLKPKEKKMVEAIQNKGGKLGFQFKSRFVYVARKEIINKPKVREGFIGYIKQFMDLDLNNLKPDMDITATSVDYFFTERRINTRKNKIMRAYKGRSTTRGRDMGVMDIEELATIWHFPIEPVVKAPMIQKAPGRKSGPPMQLPIGEEIVSEAITEPEFIEEENNNKNEKKESFGEITEQDGLNSDENVSPPANLPFA